jgi:hypothetical protein
MSIPAGAVAIGSKLYLFESTLKSNECLISAHGGFHKENRTFVVPTGATLNFYVPHGFSLTDPGMTLMRAQLNGQQSHRYTAGTECVDYVLEKYQGSHNTAGETYESIARFIQETQVQYALQSTKLNGMAVNGAKPWQISAAQQSLDLLNAMSVVTIRNRFFSAEVTLSYVIDKVREARPEIDTFHCSFCRSWTGEENSPSASIGAYRMGA